MVTLVPAALLVLSLVPSNEPVDERSAGSSHLPGADFVSRPLYSDEGRAEAPPEELPLPQRIDTATGVALVLLGGGAGCAVPLLAPVWTRDFGLSSSPLPLVAGPAAACGTVVLVSLVSQVLTGQSPLPTWYGAAVGGSLVPISLAALGVSSWARSSVLSDADRASLNTCNPTGPALCWFGFTFGAGAVLMFCSGPAIAIGAAVGASTAPAADDAIEPPVVPGADETAMHY